MKNDTAIAYVVLLVTCLAAFVGKSSGLKCYDCSSSATPTCSENFFLSLGITQMDGCTCCVKHVTSSGTTRECAALLTSYKCMNPTSGNYVCSSDFCNSANRDGSHIAIATLMTSLIGGALIAMVRFF